MDISAITDIINGATGILQFWVPGLIVITAPIAVLTRGIIKIANKSKKGKKKNGAQ